MGCGASAAAVGEGTRRGASGARVRRLIRIDSAATASCSRRFRRCRNALEKFMVLAKYDRFRACVRELDTTPSAASRAARSTFSSRRPRATCLSPIYFGPNLAGKPAAGGSSGGGGASELRRRAARHVGALPVCARWRGGEVRPRDHRRRRTDRPATRDQNCVPEPRSNTTDGRLDAQLMVPRARLAVTRSRAHGRSERARLP